MPLILRRYERSKEMNKYVPVRRLREDGEFLGAYVPEELYELIDGESPKKTGWLKPDVLTHPDGREYFFVSFPVTDRETVEEFAKEMGGIFSKEELVALIKEARKSPRQKEWEAMLTASPEYAALLPQSQKILWNSAVSFEGRGIYTGDVECQWQIFPTGIEIQPLQKGFPVGICVTSSHSGQHYDEGSSSGMDYSGTRLGVGELSVKAKPSNFSDLNKDPRWQMAKKICQEVDGFFGEINRKREEKEREAEEAKKRKRSKKTEVVSKFVAPLDPLAALAERFNRR